VTRSWKNAFFYGSEAIKSTDSLILKKVGNVKLLIHGTFSLNLPGKADMKKLRQRNYHLSILCQFFAITMEATGFALNGWASECFLTCNIQSFHS